MPCINLDLEYFSHRKILRLCAKLGPWAEIIPIKLWVYTGKFHPESGLLTGYSPEELIAIIGVRTEADRDATSILQALLDCGFLVTAVGGYQVHQWLEYQGHIAAFSIRGKTAAKKRWAKLSEFTQNDTTSIPDAMLSDDSSNAPTILTNLTELSNLNDKDKREPLKRFRPPTISEISDYCKERVNQIDPEKFFAYYESNGWRVGRNPMKSWKASIITWEKGSNHGTNKPQQFESPQQRNERLLKQYMGEVQAGNNKNADNGFLRQLPPSNA